jgi:hypothetical protein
MFNIIILVSGILLVLISGLSKACMDKLLFHYQRSIFTDFKNQQYWNPELSWRNKYKPGSMTEPKFFLSKSLLVMFTDGFHTMQFFCYNSLILGIGFMCYPLQGNFLYMILMLGLGRVLFGLMFTLFFDHILEKKSHY